MAEAHDASAARVGGLEAELQAAREAQQAALADESALRQELLEVQAQAAQRAEAAEESAASAAKALAATLKVTVDAQGRKIDSQGLEIEELKGQKDAMEANISTNAEGVEELQYGLIRERFIETAKDSKGKHGLEPDFDFAGYLRRISSKRAAEVLEVSVNTWWMLIVFLIGCAVARPTPSQVPSALSLRSQPRGGTMRQHSLPATVLRQDFGAPGARSTRVD